ncbi:MAG: S-layer homology domain-containing protein [Trueperaceae bacterium]
MKKLLITLLAAIFASGVVSAQSFPDIPANHWALEAVDDISALGIVIGFPDGTFRGNEAFTRYQAALVVSRMLDVVDDNMAAAQAMTDEDIAALRAAVEELASGLDAQGVRLSAAESAIAGLSDDVMGNTARIDELEAALADIDPSVDPAVLRDLQNQIASQRVAIDTAQATADEALARANAAHSAAEANASDVAALNELLQMLGDRVDTLEARPTASGDVDLSGVEGDIANIREFVVLLRRDQVALRDAVSALEASDEQQSADIADLQARVAQLEDNPLGITGTIELDYFVGRGGRYTFDIDRAFGFGMGAQITRSPFSTGDLLDSDDEVVTPSEERADIDFGSSFDASLTLELGAGSTFDGSGSPRGLNDFEAVATFSFGAHTDSGNTFYSMELEEFTTTFSPIGDGLLTFTYGESVTGNFTPYTLNHEDVGFVANMTAPEFLDFLDPAVHVAYLTDAVTDGYVVTGGRLTVSPLDLVTLGGSYVRSGENTGDHDDWADNNVAGNVWGVDLSAGIGPVSLAAEYASASYDEGGPNAFVGNALFAELGADFDVLGGIEFGANYRDIDEGYGTFFMDAGDFPYAADQSGFGANVGLGLFIFQVDGYFDQYAWKSDPDNTSTMAFGVDLSAELFRAFSVAGYFHQVSVDGATAADNSATERDDEYDSAFGVGLYHDGEADNALVPNLNLEFEFDRMYDATDAAYSTQRIFAGADYSLDVSIVTITPYANFEQNTFATPANNSTEIAAGTGIATRPLDIFFQPSLEAAVNYRQGSYGDSAYSGNALQYAVGLNLGEFLFPYSSLSARYSSFSGTNVNQASPSSAFQNNGDQQSAVQGYEVEWNYYDLMFAYGVYANDPDTAVDGDESTAQAFSVSYSVTF